MSRLSAKLSRLRGAATAGLLLCLTLAAAPISAQPTSLERGPLHVGFTPSTFRNVNPNDAEAAFRVFAQTVGRKQGYDLDTSTRMFESTAACEAEVKKGGLTLIVLDAMEYLGMDVPDMEPVYVHDEQGVVLKDYLLLTRRGSGLNALADLRGGDIVVLASKSGNVLMAWLEVLLLEKGLGTPEDFFKKVDVVTKPSTTVLPVFFGKKAACVVDRLSFQTMVELNPQIGSNLEPLAVSEPYLDSITCVTRTGYSSARAREDFMRSLRDLHLEPTGRQILTLFKVDRLVPFKEEYLAGVRNLRSKLARLSTPGPTAALSGTGVPDPAAEPEPTPNVSQDQRP